MAFQITSTAFQNGDTIPRDFTADGRNVSPQLKWTDPDRQAQSFALICEDPDAPRGLFTHWVLFNIPAPSRELREGFPPDPTQPNGVTQGLNDFRRYGYGGPSPPPGKPHRYFFKLYALDSPLKLPAGASRDELLSAMHGHVVEEGWLMGTYGR